MAHGPVAQSLARPIGQYGLLSSHAKVRSEVVPHPEIAMNLATRVVQLELFGDNNDTTSAFEIPIR